MRFNSLALHSNIYRGRCLTHIGREGAPAAPRAAAYVVRLPSGVCLRIPAHFEAGPLETLLGVLRRTC